MRDQGMRIGEVLSLTRTAFTLKKSGSGNAISGKLKFKGKGNKLRVLELSEFNLMLLERYKHADIYPKDGDLLFQNSKGRKIWYKYIQRRLTALYGEKYCSHDLRRAFAKRESKKGGAISSISRLMGHTNLTNTMIYDRRCFKRLEYDFNHPRPELIDTFPIGRLSPGDFFYPEEVQEIEALIRRPQDKVIFYLIALAGVRSAEINTIKKNCFFYRKRKLELNDRTIPLSKSVSNVLLHFCKKFSRYQLIFSGYSRDTIRLIFSRLSKRYGRQINPQLLRASFIVSQLDLGVDPVSLSFIVGTSYENVGRYINNASGARSLAFQYRSDIKLNL